jgi:S1-C subfamily serine protease
VGIKPGDRLVSIAGRQIAVEEDLAQSVNDKRSGDVVSVVLIRGGKTMTLQLPLLPEVLNKETTPSASYATWRLDDFPIALEYSPPVTTTECGGPLVDLSGRVIGITVGRSESHAGWAIPADEVQRLVVDAKKGKLSMWPVR